MFSRGRQTIPVHYSGRVLDQRTGNLLEVSGSIRQTNVIDEMKKAKRRANLGLALGGLSLMLIMVNAVGKKDRE